MKALKLLRDFWRDLPLTLKIAGSVSLLVFLIVPSLTLLMIQLERDSAKKELEAQAQLLADTLATLLGDDIYFVHSTQIEAVAEKIQDFPDLSSLVIYDAGGKSIYSSPQIGETNTVNRSREIWFGDEYVGRVQLGLSTESLDRRNSALITSGIALVFVALILGGSLATWMARQLARPIDELSKTANRMAAGDLSTRVGSQSRDEIGLLGDAFNEMATAIEKRDTELRNQAVVLAQRVKERTAELEQRTQYLSALNDVTTGLIGSLDLEKLLSAIVERAARLADTENAVIYVIEPDSDQMHLRVAQGHYQTQPGLRMASSQGLAGQVIASGEMIIEPDYQHFSGRLPGVDWLRTCIYMPLRSESTILGVIGLGYDQVVPIKEETINILNQFAQLASLALKTAQLYSIAQEKLRFEEEKRLAHLNSPRGRAESLSEQILKDTSRALVSIYAVAQQADQAGFSAVLPVLPSVLQSAGYLQLSELAEGFHDIRRHRAAPNYLVDGLSILNRQLESSQKEPLERAAEAGFLYKLCLQAVEADSIHDITELLPALQQIQKTAKPDSPFSELAGTLTDFSAVAQSIYSFERVDTTEDRRAYLGAAVEKLSQIERKVQSLRAADRPIAERLFEKWLAIVTGGLTDLKTRARLKWQLVTGNTWEAEIITVALRLTNVGHGLALNMRASIGESPDYEILDGQEFLDQLPLSEETPLKFRIRPRLSSDQHDLRVRFTATYDDPSGPDQVDHFADVIHMLTAPAFQYIPNPYVAGAPLEAGSPLFYGREDLFKFISENIKGNTLVLIGQRRTGKSSLLKQLPQRLGDEFVPVYLDGQGITVDPGMAAFCMALATDINFALEKRGFKAVNLSQRKFEQSPAHTFERDYLRAVRSAIGDRHLVLMLDEFEELESAVRRGALDASVFNLLRHLVQHESGLTMIFSGTHSLEGLTADYFSVLFNISLYKHVGFLAQQEAQRLIREPVAAFGMGYDDLALDKMWRVTSGHPYFLQLLCHSVVNHHNGSRRSYTTVDDVNESLDEILDSAEAHFVYLWNESSSQERQVLAALSRMMPLGEKVTPVQVEDYLAERGVSLGRQEIGETLNRLKLRDILVRHMDTQESGFGGTYAWRLGLLGLWIEKYKSLSVVQEEMHS